MAVQPLLGLPFALLAALSVVSVAASLRLMPPSRGVRSEAPHPSWDLSARVIVGTTIVVTFTAVAPVLGASLAA